ncbi:MAG: hypothetical protein IJ220_07095 [Clostridia bacterium]|nr:hypothetical protein [Clostridia bacterium]
MMLIITAIKELKRHIIMNIITFIELTVSIILVCIMVSAVMIRYKYYEPFADMYSSSGIYCEFSQASVNGSNYTSMEELLGNDDIFPYLSSPEQIVSTNKVMAFPMIENENVPCYSYSYNDELINRYRPELSSGNWFKITKTDDMLNAVVSENEYGWKVGDTIPVHFACKGWDGIIEVKIIGELEENTKLPGISHNHTGENNSNMFFSSFDYDEEKVPLLLFSYSQLKSKDVFQSLNSAIIKYTKNTDTKTLADDQKTIASFGSPFSIKLSELNENSIEYFKIQVYNYLPIIIVVMVLTLVSSISITAISARRRLHDYGIYYVCGLKWKSCSFVNLYYSLILGILSLIIALLLMRFTDSIPLLGQMTILLNIWTIVAVIAVMITFIVGSMIMPLIIIRNNTPKEILTRGDI